MSTPNNGTRTFTFLLASSPILLMLLVVASSYPGHMSLDSFNQLWQARHLDFDDWHPPTMGLLWSAFDKVVPGPLLMVIFHVSLYGFGLALLCSLFVTNRVVALFGFWLLGLFPTVLSQLGTVWKDVGLGTSLTFVAGLLSYAFVKRNLFAWCASWIFMFYALSVRHNAAPALLPFFVLGIYWLPFVSTSRPYRKLIKSAAFGLLCLSVLWIASQNIHRIAKVHRLFPVQQILVHDLVGVALATGDFVFPKFIPKLDRDTFQGLYRPESVIFLYCCSDWPVHLAMNDRPKDIAELYTVWKRVVTKHPITYLKHRWAVAKHQLSLESPEVCAPYHWGIFGNGLGLKFSDNRFKLAVRSYFDLFKNTLLFRGYFWLAMSLLILGYQLYCIKKFASSGIPEWLRISITINLSGLMYLLAYFFVATTCDFRMHWWTTLAVMLSVLPLKSPHTSNLLNECADNPKSP